MLRPVTRLNVNSAPATSQAANQKPAAAARVLLPLQDQHRRPEQQHRIEKDHDSKGGVRTSK